MKDYFLNKQFSLLDIFFISFIAEIMKELFL